MNGKQSLRSLVGGSLRLGLAVLASLSLLACRAAEPISALPSGPLIAGDARALERIAAALQQFDGAPLAREALRAQTALVACDEFLASAATSDSLFDAATCDSDVDLSPALRSLREDAALVFVLPLAEADLTSGPGATGEPLRLAGRVHVEADGSLRVEARLDPLPASSWAQLFIPADSASGPTRLASSEALIQGRMRPRAGIDIASLVSAGSQADAMFRLKSELFAGAALGDAWEFAIYMPEVGASMPPMALAVDVSSTSLARRGVQSFISELEAAWPIRAREARWEGGAVGACFYELRIMPEFAPCYAIQRDSLVFGWNSQSVSTALAAVTPTGSDAPARLVAYLDRFSEADTRLAASAASAQPALLEARKPSASLPDVSAAPLFAVGSSFSKLQVEASADSEALALTVRFQAATP